jgi:hypothetical protein
MDNKKEDKETIATKQTKQVLTLYFTENLVDSLDDLIHSARKKMPAYKRRKLNRTTLIQTILDEVMDDYAKFQEESFVWKLLLNTKDV